ncbi:MAG TPA: hypothetical protein VGQ86_04495 [Candidatus Limnocylindria bacterium]|nr:hypothetical protein [Candidatus Limnocylindria bacterium]
MGAAKFAAIGAMLVFAAACGSQPSPVTPPAPPRPLIFIPGFLGSELVATADANVTVLKLDGTSRTIALHAGEDVWPHFHVDDMGSLVQLAIDPDYYHVLMFDAAGQPLTSVIKPSGRMYVGPEGYPDAEAFFVSHGYRTGRDLFLFGWDFRYPTASQVAELDTFVGRVLAQTGAASVDIVAHSGGAAVLRELMRQPSSQQRGKVAHAVLLSGVHLGTPKSLDTLILGKCLKDFLFVCVLPPEHIRFVTRTWPGAVEDAVLSNYYTFFQNQSDGLHPLAYISSGDFEQPPADQFQYPYVRAIERSAGVSESLISAAEAFRQTDLTWLASALQTPAKITLAGGSGKCAMGQIRNWAGVQYVGVDGDTIVPRQSAILGDGFAAEYATGLSAANMSRLTVYVRPIEHGEFANDAGLPDVLEIVRHDSIRPGNIAATDCRTFTP